MQESDLERILDAINNLSSFDWIAASAAFATTVGVLIALWQVHEANQEQKRQDQQQLAQELALFIELYPTDFETLTAVYDDVKKVNNAIFTKSLKPNSDDYNALIDELMLKTSDYRAIEDDVMKLNATRMLIHFSTNNQVVDNAVDQAVKNLEEARRAVPFMDGLDDSKLGQKQMGSFPKKITDQYQKNKTELNDAMAALMTKK